MMYLYTLEVTYWSSGTQRRETEYYVTSKPKEKINELLIAMPPDDNTGWVSTITEIKIHTCRFDKNEYAEANK